MTGKITGLSLWSRRAAMAALTGLGLTAICAGAGLADGTHSKGAAGADERVYRIGIHLWKPGAIYDEAMAGIIDGLELEGIRYETVILEADRNADIAERNLRELDGMGLDLIYSLSSAGTKIAKNSNLKTPVIATVVNHPASLGLTPESSRMGTRISGTSYYVDAAQQLSFYRTLFPDVDSVGMVFDTDNPAGSLAEEPFMEQACGQAGLEFVSVGVTDESELPKAAKKLIEAGVDIIVVPTNLLVYDHLDAVLKVANDKRIPVMSMNKQGVENGALAGLFADTYNLGRLSVPMAMRIIRDGADPADIGFEYLEQPEIIVNMSAAAQLGYEFPAAVLGNAAIVLQ